jgi:hypothetical protein
LDNALVRSISSGSVHQAVRSGALALSGLGFALCIVACTEDSPTLAPAKKVEAPIASAQAITATVALASRSLAVSQDGGRCVLTIVGKGAAGSSQVVPLDLREPCQLVVWQADAFKGPKAASGGVRIGADGEAMAWRYASAKNVTVAMVMGDAISEAAKSQRPNLAQMGFCAANRQALLLPDDVAAPVRVLPKSSSPRVICARFGVDEKDFWLAAHDQ